MAFLYFSPQSISFLSHTHRLVFSQRDPSTDLQHSLSMQDILSSIWPSIF